MQRLTGAEALFHAPSIMLRMSDAMVAALATARPARAVQGMLEPPTFQLAQFLACSRRTNFWIFPVDVLGMGVKMNLPGTL